jgi:hypothetical protein
MICNDRRGDWGLPPPGLPRMTGEVEEAGESTK